MERKKYKCEIEGCDSQLTIRSTIKDKDSEYYGKKVCPYHLHMFSLVKKEHKIYKFKPMTKKTQEKRNKRREGFSEFFQKHIQLIQERELCCEECGDRLVGHVSEVAHLVKKSTNNEIAIEPHNVVYLCGMFSRNNCHAKFDSDFETRNNMKVFPIALQQFKHFRDKIVNVTNEVLNYEKHLI